MESDTWSGLRSHGCGPRRGGSYSGRRQKLSDTIRGRSGRGHRRRPPHWRRDIVSRRNRKCAAKKKDADKLAQIDAGGIAARVRVPVFRFSCVFLISGRALVPGKSASGGMPSIHAATSWPHPTAGYRLRPGRIRCPTPFPAAGKLRFPQTRTYKKCGGNPRRVRQMRI